MKKSLFLSLLLIAFSSCSVRLTGDETSAVQTIIASSEPELSTKNTVDNSTFEVTWTASDAINVFFGSELSSRFVTSESGAIAKFKGSIDVVTGGGEGIDDDTTLWGVYPYKDGTRCDGRNVYYTLPATQQAAGNTVANGLYPVLARSRNFYMSFYILCSSIRFTVSSPDIRAVTLKGNNGEVLAGRAKVSMVDNSAGGFAAPSVESVEFGETALTMTAPDGGCFKPGVNYYFVLFPTDFTKGLSVTYFKSDNTCASFVTSSRVNLPRRGFSRLKDKDAGLTFVPGTLDGWGSGDNVEGEI